MAFIDSIFDNLFGEDPLSAIGQGSSSQVISKDAARCFGKDAVECRSAFEKTWLPALAAIIGTYGYIKQYELQKEALALQERSIRIAERGIELAERNYNEIAIPIFQRFRDYFDDCVGKMKQWQERFIEKAFDCEDYQPQYKVQEGRARARVSAQFDAVRKKVRRSRGKNAVGYVKSEEIRLAIAEGVALSDVTNRAYRFEESKKIRLDQICFERCQAAASLANNITGQAFNGLNGAASITQNGIRSIQGAQANLIAAQNAAAQATTQFADLFGSVANSAFGFVGFSTFQAPQQANVFASPAGFSGLNNAGGLVNLGGSGGTGLTGNQAAGLVGGILGNL